MNKITYNKLIRDKIPQIIKESGSQSKTYIADINEYKSLLLAKLVEESKELQEEPCIEELADIMEVLESIKAVFNFSDHDIEKKKEEKKDKRGGFDERIILEYVYDK
jgi:predicted house-cleaning noncanonical NTP pyrophosphatase (MazG superfamily)